MLLNAQALVQHANCGEPGGGNTGQLRGKGEAADAINWTGTIASELGSKNDGTAKAVEVFRAWSETRAGVFAQAWGSRPLGVALISRGSGESQPV